MKNIYIIFCILFTAMSASPNTLFDTKEYELNFSSENINTVKEEKINEIKIKSFENIIKKILTNDSLKKINITDISLINNFILNFKVNDEKIINNNYYSKIQINFNNNLIFDYLIKNKIPYVDQNTSKFLIVIIIKDELQTYLLNQDNVYYSFLNSSENLLYSQNFILPNLDYNDRYLFNKYEGEFDDLNQINNLAKKYDSRYQILIESSKRNNFYDNSIYLIFNKKKYFLKKIQNSQFEFEKLFSQVINLSKNKWKEINQIDTSFSNTILCRLEINNIEELIYVRKFLKSNRIIKNFQLNTIELNQNLYEITYFGNMYVLDNLLEKHRLTLIRENNICIIKLI